MSFFSKVFGFLKTTFTYGKTYYQTHPEEVTKVKDVIEEVIKKGL